MRKTFKHILFMGAVVLAACFTSCSDEVLVNNDGTHSDEGTLLCLAAGIENDQPKSRLAELGGEASELAQIINEGSGKDQKLKHIGLYIYYTDDYGNDKDPGDLSNPYIRNLRCNITDGKITPCDENGNALTDDAGKIYIYDRMTIVAFYPYNEDMSKPEHFFKKKIDEEAYPISMSIYADQKYIPYRAQTDVNPTNAYYRTLGFHVKHTAKIEVVLVSKDKYKLPVTDNCKSGDIKILPKLDPYNDTQDGGLGYSTDTREHWLDALNQFPENNGATEGGLYTCQYVAYLWTSNKDYKHHDNGNNNYGTQGGITDDRNHWDNNIDPNDIVFQSDKITLFSSQYVDLTETRVYRYGYNMDTGEVFIPTSSKLVYDANSLQALKCDKTSAYQVCNIDLSTKAAWTPLTIMDGTYDGGGHKITNFSIAKDNAASGAQIGLFANINGTSYIRNVNLIKPNISVIGKDSCFVGAICGQINPRLTADQIKDLNKNLPEGLSEVVKAELMKDLIAEMSNSTSQIISCRVENPTITVSSAKARVGAICGAAGDKDEQGRYFSKIWDSYSLDGTIKVNENAPANNQTALVGGLCGANNGRILHSYSTTTATATNTGNQNNAAGLSRKGYFADNFSTLEVNGNKRYDVVDCYVKAKRNDHTNVKQFSDQWPSATWVTYTGKWPVYSNDWKDPDDGTDGTSGHPSTRSYWKNVGNAPSTYPTLLWEREY